MKSGEFRELSADELRAQKELEEQLFRLRIQKSMGQLDNALKMRPRRDIARIKTVLREKEAV